MKQKIVLKVTSMVDDKCRSKALNVSASLSGVTSVAITGEDKRKIEVIGDDVDIAELTKLLRKKVGFAELETLGPHPPPKKDEKKPDDKKQDDKKAPPPCLCPCQPCAWHCGFWSPYYPYPVSVSEPYPCQQSWCSQM